MNYEKALEIAKLAHAGQVDKGGNDYVEHPIRVSEKFITEEEKIVSLLHDTIEDTFITEEVLRDAGFSERVITAIVALTRNKDETYWDFIERVCKNTLARGIKIGDIKDNMDITRIKTPTKEDFSRIKKYEKALKILLEYTPE